MAYWSLRYICFNRTHMAHKLFRYMWAHARARPLVVREKDILCTQFIFGIVQWVCMWKNTHFNQWFFPLSQFVNQTLIQWVFSAETTSILLVDQARCKSVMCESCVMSASLTLCVCSTKLKAFKWELIGSFFSISSFIRIALVFFSHDSFYNWAVSHTDHYRSRSNQ